MICPACGEIGIDLYHLADCGVICQEHFRCVCGVDFWQTNRALSIKRDFLEHCKAVPHNWKKLLTRKTLEGF